MSFEIKQNDRKPDYKVRLESGGEPIDLTDCYVTFIMRAAAGDEPKVSAPAAVDDAVGGLVRYEWQSGDTDTPGTFRVEWEITYPGFLKRTVPSKGYGMVVVTSELG